MSAPTAPRSWRPAVLYPLQPAPHFEGRAELLVDLKAWAMMPGVTNRVTALIAAGGTGKTALAERVVAGLPGENPFGVFVWSFYENPQTEAFLRAACEYFLGETPKDMGGLVERLQTGLRTDGLPHLVVLDGLELVQATGTTGRPPGELEDPQMRRLLRWMAADRGPQAKALITSRFSLPDLANWRNCGFRTIELEDLDVPAARAVLRKWRVKGTDAVLDTLAASVHRHALTVEVLGSYLQTYWGGDPERAPLLDPASFSVDPDPKTARLHQILTEYAEKLSLEELALLVRLSVFPRGLNAQLIGDLIRAGGRIAGALAGCQPIKLLRFLERLRTLGLVFKHGTGDAIAYTAHPFLRSFFAQLYEYDADPGELHEAVRRGLMIRLTDVPERFAQTEDLDRYELLVDISRLAGRAADAFKLYHEILGGYQHLGRELGETTRGLRILTGFSSDSTPQGLSSGLDWSDAAAVLGDWGLFATDLGELGTARAAFECQEQVYRHHLGARPELVCINLGHHLQVELLAGRWPKAVRLAYYLQVASRIAQLHGFTDLALLGLATAEYRMGEVGKANGHRAELKSHRDSAAGSCTPGILRTEWGLLVRGREARGEAEDSLRLARLRRWTRDEAVCLTLLGHAELPDHTIRARGHLSAARDYLRQAGNVEVALRCHYLAVRVGLLDGNVARAEAEAGIQLADSCGFGRWSLDIRTELARGYLMVDEPVQAVEPAEWVLTRSQEDDCKYAWGIADSLHLLGVAHARLGDITRARDYLSGAVEKRKALTHPGLADTEAELEKLR